MSQNNHFVYFILFTVILSVSVLHNKTNYSTNMAYAEPLLSSLAKAKLSPGPLVPEGFKPSVELKVSYGGKDVTSGNYLKTGETTEAPSFSFSIDVCIYSCSYMLLS